MEEKRLYLSLLLPQARVTPFLFFLFLFSSSILPYLQQPPTTSPLPSPSFSDAAVTQTSDGSSRIVCTSVLSRTYPPAASRQPSLSLPFRSPEAYADHSRRRSFSGLRHRSQLESQSMFFFLFLSVVRSKPSRRDMFHAAATSVNCSAPLRSFAAQHQCVVTVFPCVLLFLAANHKSFYLCLQNTATRLPIF